MVLTPKGYPTPYPRFGDNPPEEVSLNMRLLHFSELIHHKHKYCTFRKIPIFKPSTLYIKHKFYGVLVMVKITFYLFTFFFTSNVFAQSVYLNSKKTCFSVSSAVAVNKNALGYGISTSSTLKGTTNFVISYGRAHINNTYDDESNTLTGQSLQIYIGFMVANELDKMHKFGIEFGFVGLNNWYGNYNEINGISSYGVVLELSKKITQEFKNSMLIPKLRINANPIEIIKVDSYWRGESASIVGESFIVISTSLAYVNYLDSGNFFVLEPSLGFDISDFETPSFGLTS